MNRYASLAVFILLVLGLGTLIGLATLPGDWYAGLTKPPFNPPNWVFGPVWSLLYVLIAVAGWLVWRSEPGGPAMRAWIAQLVLNFLWSPVFFGARQVGLALVVVALLLATILTFMRLAWKRHRAAAWLFVPYACWVAFATLLNASIWLLNAG